MKDAICTESERLGADFTPFQIKAESSPVIRGRLVSVERESLASPGACTRTAAVRCDVAAPAMTGAKLLRNGLKNVTFTGRQLQTVS